MFRFLQADVGLFTEPKGKVSPKPPPKPPKKAPVESQAQVIPTTLVPARSIGSHGTNNSTSLQRPHTSPSKPASIPLPPGLVPARNPSFSQSSAPSSGVSTVSSKPSTEPPVADSSRTPPAPSEPAAKSAPEPAQKPRLVPPVKRPKQPPSIFIPKKVCFDPTLLITLITVSISSVPFRAVEVEGLRTKSERSAWLVARPVAVHIY